MTTPGAGVRLGIDWGQARIGVAACDRAGVLAFPVETIPAADAAAVRRRLVELVAEYEPVGIVVGLPRHLKGVEGEAAASVRERAAWLARLFPGVDVRLVDERMTTLTAAAQLRAAGRPGKSQRQVIDQVSAVAILNHALDTERHTGRPAGEPVGEGTVE